MPEDAKIEPKVEVPLVEDGEDADGSRPSRLFRYTRRLFDKGGELGEDAKVLVSAVLETSDKAKSEAVKMVGREVRNYLDALQWKEDLRELLTSHELEVHARFSLKPKAPETASEAKGDAKVEGKAARPAAPGVAPATPAVESDDGSASS